MKEGVETGTITVSCPSCGVTHAVPETAIPPGTTRATCHTCGTTFPFSVAAEPVPPVVPAGPRELRMEFIGSAREYFGIWIVNTLLTIVTLGVYTAWAKVRKRRYFYGATRLDGISFDYLADPLALLKGWLIGAGLFIAYTVLNRVVPIIASTIGTIFFVAVPWLIVRSRMFSLRNSSHRNIRFTFRENYEEAYLVFAGLVVLTPFTLGILLPYVTFRQKQFFIRNSGFGSTLFSFDSRPGVFYGAYLKSFGVFLLTAALLGLVVFLGATWLDQLYPFLHTLGGTGKPFRTGAQLAMAAGIAVVIAVFLIVSVYLRTMITNITWNATRLGPNRFASTLKARRMIWLYVSSAVAILCTCGLLIPWASIRITHYRLGCLSLLAVDDPARYEAASVGAIDAAGEEIGDIFGIDMSL